MRFISLTQPRRDYRDVIIARRPVVRDRGERQPKTGTLSRFTLNFHLTGMLRHDLANNYQSQTGALAAIFRRVERIEDMALYIFAHAGSRVGEINDEALRFAGLTVDEGTNLELAALRHLVEIVVNQIQEQLLQPIFRADHDHKILRSRLNRGDFSFSNRP